METKWARRNGNIWELFIDGKRKGGIKCMRHPKGYSVYAARKGGQIVSANHSRDNDGLFGSLSGAKMSVERACGLVVKPKC